MSEETVVAPALSTAQDEQEVFQKVEETEHHRPHLRPVSSDQDLETAIRDYYSVPELAEYLSKKNDNGALRFNNITLQFPDHLVQDSAIVSRQLQTLLAKNGSVSVEKSSEKTTESCGGEGGCKKCADCEHDIEDIGVSGQKIWILADTSYSTCCVDEIAAEHVGSDIVVHFGDSCLTPIDKIPTVYIFGKAYLDHEAVKAKFRETYDKDAKVVLMSDTTYCEHLKGLWTELKDEYPYLAYSSIPPYGGKGDIIPQPQTGDGVSVAGRVIHGISPDAFEHLDPEDFTQVTQDYQLFHIGTPQTPRLLLLSTVFSGITLYDTASKSTSNGPFPLLQRRYRFMHIARTAGTVGVLVNTLSLENTKTVLNTVVKWIKDAGKKHYMFVVGKPNVAKLSNFEAVDVWCVLGCSQSGTIVDNTGEYYKPIITPYELKLALSPEVTWTGKWVTDFKDVLELDESEREQESDDNDEQEERDLSAPEFDPVTGKYITHHAPVRQLQHLSIEIDDQDDQEGQLVKKLSSAVAIKDTVSTSAIQLQSREWRGLGSDYNNDEEFDEAGAKVEDGRAGIARGYTTGGARY